MNKDDLDELREMQERLRNDLPDKLVAMSSAKRDFKNELGREITAGIEIGRLGGYCRLYLYGPNSGIDSYTTRFELAMIYEVLCEIFGEADAIEALLARIDMLEDTIVELWHESEAAREPLHHYLGMTEEEYARWANPSALVRSE